MKKSFAFLIIILSLLFFACDQHKGKGKFEVTGQVKNSAGKKIFLEEIDLDKKQPVAIDSQTLASDGVYNLKSHIAGQHLFILRVDGGHPFLLINDNHNINMDINPIDPLHPSISNSDATLQLYGFINVSRTKDSMLSATYMQWDSLNKLPTTTHAQDSLIDVLAKQKDNQIKQINNDIKNFVDSANNPVAIFYVLNVMSPNTMEPKDLLPIAQAASDRFKDDGTLAAFLSRVKEANANENDANSNFNLLNQSAPDLAMQTPEGKNMKISDFKGKYLLVDFWASWCGPCRGENPNVVKVYNKYKDKNFTILGVSLDMDKDAWIKAIRDDKLTWNQMSDLKYWQSAAVQTYHFDGIPFNVLIDPSGKIIADNLRGDDLDNKLNGIFNRNAQPKTDSTNKGS